MRPNGCALLAKAGMRTTLLEARDIVGHDQQHGLRRRGHDERAMGNGRQNLCPEARQPQVRHARSVRQGFPELSRERAPCLAFHRNDVFLP